MQFMDENNGFAVYSRCGVNGSWECINGLAATKDGGASWTLTPINNTLDISSDFFSSSTTGFLSALDWIQTQSLIFKTEDGGKTWKEYLIGSFDAFIYRYLIFKYANSQTGYAHQYGAVFITKNGGESWEQYTFIKDLPEVDYEEILCMKVIDDNTYFAGLSLIGSYTHPTSIVKSKSGSLPKEVAVIPYKIWQLEFSPLGKTGFAVGLKDIDLSSNSDPIQLALHKSIDNGETWYEEYIDLNELIFQPPYIEVPSAMSVPSDNVVYILYAGQLVKYHNL
jgi:hypothetical protein